MNSMFEIAEEPVVEVLDESMLPTLVEPEEYGVVLKGYGAKAMTLVPTDPVSLMQCAAFVETCKMAAKFAETRRKALVDPLNQQLKQTNEIWMPITKGFDQIWREVDGRVSRYVYQQQQLALEEQRKEIERARLETLRLEQQAEQARIDAAAAAESGDKKAEAKAEAKADRLDLASEMVVAVVVPMAPKTIDLGGATLSTKAPKKVWMLPGYDKKEKMYGDDLRLKGIDPVWLLKFCVLDPAKLNKAYGTVEFPAPFYEGQEFGGSVLRGSR